jgi:bifunctional UDP-N-acetylglucosamine pyrophosphorylase / glucosamine-1-phosphate N-acetyltransferase
VNEEIEPLETTPNATVKELAALSDVIDPERREVSIVLAAGHGKRIKSEKSKMLHEIWGKPSVRTVCTAALERLGSDNQVVVVGIKAVEVARALGRRKNRIFVFQDEQKGTGDAVRRAIMSPRLSGYTGDVYVFPGDMGLLSKETVARFREDFLATRCDMLVMTGLFEGSTKNNYYGRIVPSKRHRGEIIEIKEYKDILALPRGRPYAVSFRNTHEEFDREELIEIREFNTGVYAFRVAPLLEQISRITTDNVQGEVYVTDLIKIFNDQGLAVRSSKVKNNSLVEGFNVKSVLKKMDETYREMVYERLKDIISIDDADDFYIAEETVQRILEMDGLYPSLDMRVGKGAYIGERVQPGRGLTVGRNAILDGNIRFGENVSVGESAIVANYPGQLIEIGTGASIFRGNVIQGQISIGNGVRIETGVRITGSSSDPVTIGNNVLVKGMTYIYGSVIEDDVLIEHSILKKMRVLRIVKRNGEVQAVKYILPRPEGLDSVTPIL